MENTFNKEWWEGFLKTNENFTKTCVIKDVIPKEMIASLHKAVIDGLINRFKMDDKDGFRLYFPAQGKGKEDTEFTKELYKTPPQENENITDYCNRVFKEKFGMIINFVEKHSQAISDELRTVVDPLLQVIGIPACGVDVTVFIGNYGWTPLGIHQDHKGENVLHFHLGPGDKTMYIWDEVKYKELTGTKHNNFDIDPLLEHAEKYDFGTGDLFFMPWNKFHLGKSDELSVGVTFWFNNPSKVKFFDRVFNTFYTQYVELNEDVVEPQKEYLTNETTYTEFLSLLKIDKTVLERPTIDFFRYLYEEYKLSLLSNGGWQTTLMSREVKNKYKVDDYEHLADKEIASRHPFMMYYRYNEGDDNLTIYVRGSKVEMRYHEEVINIVKKINTHEKLKVSELLEPLSKEWPQEAGLYFLSMLYDKRGIEIYPELIEEVKTEQIALDAV